MNSPNRLLKASVLILFVGLISAFVACRSGFLKNESSRPPVRAMSGSKSAHVFPDSFYLVEPPSDLALRQEYDIAKHKYDSVKARRRVMMHSSKSAPMTDEKPLVRFRFLWEEYQKDSISFDSLLRKYDK